MCVCNSVLCCAACGCCTPSDQVQQSSEHVRSLELHSTARGSTEGPNSALLSTGQFVNNNNNNNNNVFVYTVSIRSITELM